MRKDNAKILRREVSKGNNDEGNPWKLQVGDDTDLGA